jgi:hypothetical protein
MADSLTYGDWLKAKRSYRASYDEKEFLENRVRRLRDEQRSMEATIANAREKVAMIDDARQLMSSRRSERKEREDRLAMERAAQHDRVQSTRQESARGVQQARLRVLQDHTRARETIRTSEGAHLRSVSARRAAEQADLVRRRELIRGMQMEALEQRRKYLETRRLKLQEMNARHGTHVTTERSDNVKAAAELLVVEADILRNLVELRREARRQTSALAERVTGKPARQLADDEDDEVDHHHGTELY